MRIIKTLLLLLTVNVSLFALTTIQELRYESGISIYGQIGIVELFLEENNDRNTYKITVKTTSTGIVKYLTNNRIDTFISEGTINNGTYLPSKFTRKTSKNNYKKLRTYLFDYANQTVQKTEVISRLKIKTIFEPISVSFTQKEELIKEIKEENIDFERNDFLSLYLNLVKGNLKYGKVPYVDMKEKDELIFVKENLFEVHKNHREDTYFVEMTPDEDSAFFKQVTSLGISFYGDAYIKKIHQKSRIFD